MHLAILVEDSSGEALLEQLMPKILGPFAAPHTWVFHSYKGVGRLPKDLASAPSPKHRQLLDKLPALIRGLDKTTGSDAIVVVLDSDRNDCRALLGELQSVVAQCRPQKPTLIRLAIEEVEAWYLGDRKALTKAYPKAKKKALATYVQDSVCGTWERLADAIHPGGSAAVKAAGWPLPGQLKHEWAEAIGPWMDVEANQSPSFQKLRDGLRRLAS